MNNTNNYGHSIRLLSLKKNINGSEEVLLECSNISCNFDDSRMKVSRSMDRQLYNINYNNIIMHCTICTRMTAGITSIATADVRRPSNVVRVQSMNAFQWMLLTM